MYIPSATYRIQTNSEFRLKQVKEIINYLEQLGISTIYCAPIFQARSGSNHGYDVTDPHVINSEVGSLDDLKSIADQLHNKNMGWLQDIVPNHMAFDYTNVWLRDVFEKGMHSDYSDFFDIDWNQKNEKLNGKVLVPCLGESLTKLLEYHDIQLEYNQQGFFINYGNANFPLSWFSYYKILSCFNDDRKLSEHADYNTVLDDFEQACNEHSKVKVIQIIPQLKERLHDLYTSIDDVKSAIDNLVVRINDHPKVLQNILDEQFFVLAHYTITDHKINYRRFFIVNDLICLQMENPKVFSHYHLFVKSLLDQGLIQGLRVDHIDGLSNPSVYLESLRALVGKDTYIIVEKIVEANETMPSQWPIEGTTGYEFLALVNHLFTAAESKDKLTALYEKFTGSIYDYKQLVFEKKYNMLVSKMGGDLENLMQQLVAIDSLHEVVEDRTALKKALSVLLVSFSIYRTYVDALPMKESDIKSIKEAFEFAMYHQPSLSSSFQYLKTILLINQNDILQEKKLKFLLRFQQYTGPLAAKGIEDTVFYLYNRLLSHNEVGDSPDHFGITTMEFHEKMKLRLKYLPLALNTTSTHDTKRGEDARMRINVLSHMPDTWIKLAFKWKNMNAKYKRVVEGQQIPDDNEEYFIYQAILGAFPADEVVDDEFIERMKAYMTKSLREGNIHSAWAQPNDFYEKHIHLFIGAVLSDADFLTSFLSLFSSVREKGELLSLGQTLLKITAPGIPDTYQGTELWDLSLVDPDNRRAVDYERRKQYLLEFNDKMSTVDRCTYTQQLLENSADGRIKLFTTWAALQERKQNALLFQSGVYLPLTFIGPAKDDLIGFARKLDKQWSITVARKSFTHLESQISISNTKIWEETLMLLPAEAPDEWLNVFTMEYYGATHYTLEDKQPVNSDDPIDASFSDQMIISKIIGLDKLFKHFPVALLTTAKN